MQPDCNYATQKQPRLREETGLYYLIARYYQPEDGVFLTVDPEGGDTEDPKIQNGYNYANNNPVMMTDPDGDVPWASINAGFATYSGYKAYKSGKGASGIVAAAAVGFIGGGKGKAVKKGIGLIKKIHRNSRWSRRVNHATRQANKWAEKFGGTYHTRVVKKNMTRKKH
ncbi:RHS repeat-associated core domain-containing protein [Pseudobacillus badius]|uniref:RHS repeat-associated core domain-containing protein n=1 Tax=Bacillus badius TaxID=1455 RepID=UPI001CC13AEA|nr:RHS repeat-associated core domain-containing protein [Bacillus badius]